MKKKNIPLGQKEEIITMYKDRSVKVQEILETYEISNNILNRILEEENVPKRRPKAAGKRTNVKLDKCPVCGKFIREKDARYCYWCGADVRSKKDRVLENLGTLWSKLYPNFISYDEKEEVKNLFDEITKYIQNN